MNSEVSTSPKSPTVSHTHTYKAAVLKSPGTITVMEGKIPEPGKGEVRVRLEGSGVCASNLPVWEGRDWFDYPVPPGNPGHEGWGVIDALGEGVKDWKLGDRVTGLSFNAYATHDVARSKDLVKLPDFLDVKAFPGEPLGCAMNIFKRSDISQGQTVAVVGCGFLGLLLIQLAKSAGARVIAISRRSFSLETAKEAGADATIALDDHYKIIEQVKDLTQGQFCDRVIEATGKEWPLNLSIELTAEGGKLIVAGFHQDGMRNLNVQLLNWRGIDMISAHEREPEKYLEGMRMAIEAIEDNRMNPFPYFTHQLLLEDSQTAFKLLSERPDGFIKALIINP